MTTPKRLATIAGLLYLGVAVFALFAQYGVRARVYVPGDPSATAGNVVANAGLVRVGVVADLFQATFLVFLAMALYLLLRHVNTDAARAMVVLVAIATTITCLNIVFQFGALLVATDGSYTTALGSEGANALVQLLLDIHHYGYLIAQIFFGLWLVPLGYLAYRSRTFPRTLGVLLVIGGVCYVADTLALFLVPDFGAKIVAFDRLPSTIAEVWMLGYLLVKGLKSPGRTDHATVAA